MIRTSTSLGCHRSNPRRRADGWGVAQRRQSTRAFTLMEILLVIAIMVALLAIAWPSLQGSFDRQRLRKAGERIQAEWTKARNRAIRTGRVHVFQHTLHSSFYLTRVQSSLEDDLQSAAASSDTTQFTTLTTPNQTMKELPQGVVFMAADVQLDQRTTLEMNSLEASPVQSDFASATSTDVMARDLTWGMPVFFFPDGTTSSAQMILANDRQESITLQLRGLTGVVRLGRVESFAGQFPSEVPSR